MSEIHLYARGGVKKKIKFDTINEHIKSIFYWNYVGYPGVLI